jgi:hypothetical protein
VGNERSTEMTIRRDPSSNDGRPDLFDLWKQHHFDTEQVAKIACVSEQAVLCMLRFQPVPIGVAKRVLAVVERLFQGGYNLLTVKIKILDAKEAEEMDASDLAAIGRVLKETREYSIDPVFTEAIRKRFLSQCQAQKENRT